MQSAKPTPASEPCPCGHDDIAVRLADAIRELRRRLASHPAAGRILENVLEDLGIEVGE